MRRTLIRKRVSTSVVDQRALLRLVARYETQQRAAETWGVSQPLISQMVSGSRTQVSRQTLANIASAEGCSVDELVLQGPRAPDDVDKGSDAFLFDINDPAGMVMQLLHWFRHVPPSLGAERFARAAVRVVIDGVFSDALRPPATWGPVVNQLYGLGGLRDSKGQPSALALTEGGRLRSRALK